MGKKKEQSASRSPSPASPKKGKKGGKAGKATKASGLCVRMALLTPAFAEGEGPQRAQARPVRIPVLRERAPS
jgi:hypothetical protein